MIDFFGAKDPTGERRVVREVDAALLHEPGEAAGRT
jgi:hypothetical protein